MISGSGGLGLLLVQCEELLNDFSGEQKLLSSNSSLKETYLAMGRKKPIFRFCQVDNITFLRNQTES